jgi:hypothetical protein
VSAYIRRYGTAWTFRVGTIGGAFSRRHQGARYSLPTTLWWRMGPRWMNGPGWQVKFFERATDYRTFSERQGITTARKIGPLTIKRLKP